MLGRWPRKRGRFWRYVSPRRHGVGLLALAMLTLVVYGYWYQTNDRRIRRKAEDYLERLTGGRAKIHKAAFSFFGGIELKQVRLYQRGPKGPGPFFRARRVLMRHWPWAVLVSGRVEPTEIVCIEPILTVEYQADRRAYAFKKWFRPPAQLRAGAGRAIHLPRIRVRDGKLRVLDVAADQRSLAGEVPVDLSMVPREGRYYQVVFEQSPEQPGGTIQGKVVLDLATGRITEASGVLPLASLDKTLPRRYRQWRQRYNLAGEVRLARTLEQGQKGRILTAELVDVSLSLPAEQGALELRNARGRLIFDPQGVTLEKVTGRIPQAGDAQVEISGRYSGYEPTAAYDVAMTIRGLAMPACCDGTGDLPAALENVRRTYQPKGPMDVTVAIRRDAEGEVTYEGLARPRGMSLVFEHFPYRIENVRGEIAFRPGIVELRGLTAQRGQATCRIDGQVAYADGRKTYDVTVKAADVLFDQELQDAVPEGFQPFWKALRPRGRSALDVHVRRRPTDQREQVEVHLALDGNGSIEYQGFPYRIENLTGDAYMSARQARIDNVRGFRGRASCTINGTLDNLGSDELKVQLTIAGENLPLDGLLARAAGPKGLKALEQLRPDGSTGSFFARVWKVPGSDVGYEVSAELKDVHLNPKGFAYYIDGVDGTVTVRPASLTIDRLDGRHGPATISAAGRVHFYEDEFGLDLTAKARNVPFDDDLYQALPESLKDAWRQLSPGGRADVRLSIRRNLPTDRGESDYELVLDAHDMSAVYRDFPYPLRGISGRVVATPGKMVLDSLTVKSGRMTGALAGVLLSGRAGRRAQLTVAADGVPINADLLAAFPAELAPLAERLQPRGTCDVNFRRLEFFQPNAPAPGEEAGTQPAGPAPAALWRLVGSATFRDAAVNIGLTPKIITGRITGTGYRSREGIALEAEVDFDSVVAGQRRVTELRGRMVKSPTSSTIKIDDLSAKSHGGRLAGFALVELTDPLRYQINLVVDRMRLEELFSPAGGESTKISGLLEGRIELVETAGDVGSRQASGILRIGQAQLYKKLPILLDLLTVVYLTVPGDSAFNEGQFTYHLRGDKLVLSEIYLRGPAISLVGSGTMSMKTQELKLYFLIDPLGRLPRLSGLADELLTRVFREIMEVEVSGTLSAPKTRTRTLGSIEDTIRKLLSPDAEQE